MSGSSISQPDISRMLRMTSVRRRRQMLGMDPFSTQNPVSGHSLSRLRQDHTSFRSFQNSERDLASNLSQNDPFVELDENLGMNDSDLMTSLTNPSFSESDRRSELSRDSSGSGSNQNSMTRLIQDMLGRIANSPDTTTRDTSTDEGTHPNSMLGRILATVAAAEAPHLFIDDPESSESPTNTDHPHTEDSRITPSFLDLFLSEFHSTMYHNHRSEQGGNSIEGHTNSSEQPTSPSFFQLFRSGSNGQPHMDERGQSPNPSESIGHQINTEPGVNSQLIPVIILGIRGVDTVNSQTENVTSNVAPSQTTPDLPGSRFSMANTVRNHDVNNSSQATNEPNSHLNDPDSNRESGQNQPNPRELVHSQSYIIYVIGSTYPSNHPLLTTALSENPTYEDLLFLSSFIGPVRPPTTSQSEIDANLPIATFDSSIPGVQGFQILNPESCQVCLCGFEDQDKLRVLKCQHAYHRDCIDKWLTEGANKCPICRGTAVETKSTTKSSKQGEESITERAHTALD